MNSFSKSRSYSRRTAGALLLVGVLAGVTIGGGVGVIAASSTKTVTVCANKKTNVLRYAKNGKCVKKTETKVLLNQTGADGITGATGPKGDTGAAGTNGATGPKGDTGAAGTNGATGLKGDVGNSGANTNSQVKNICGENGTTACAIGLKGPGGGIVFMTPSTLGNTSGLFYEVAPSNWSSPSGDPRSIWCDNTNESLGAPSTRENTGAMDGATKTNLILSVCTSGAANIADAYTATINGVVYGDWFLPSKGELKQVYFNRENMGSFQLDRYYWSSSEFDSGKAWAQTFDGGWQNWDAKLADLLVRPVRAF
ncbi:MAG: DUF1566 domain-containing protein [Actinobacteria bacterium]|uniref:Unannotated protein n=1 Tax=freshwater metagenome TaxID=449393 RepID=A0A6J6MZ86_9ZZZZ|nr:DUF1566 domain-containing protein [Actinomycetota bacterium]MSZ60788.1 DUF1566 domain-containing protein [Actinomycetota bacterium]MSZ80316.1 DUF1566 domain-containing protein [Actinomycetota bacterium]MTB12586.1 DUF1566 domain-containing protein [Actinomycetota bacterium]